MGFESILKMMLKGAASGGFSKGKRKHRSSGWEAKAAAAVISAVGGAIAQQLSQNQPPAPPTMAPGAAPPVPPPPPPNVVQSTIAPPANPSDARALLVVRAMVAAANADHHIDDSERQRILSKAEFLGLDDAERRVLHAEFDRPTSIAALAREAAHDAGLSRQVYLASLLTLDLDTDEERRYLARLAEALRIPPSEVRELHEQAEL